MIGRQVSFFLGPSDQMPFEQALKSAGDMVILKGRSRSSRPETLHTSVIARYGEEHLRVLLSRPDDLGAITYCPVATRAEYYCNPTYAPVV